MLQITSLLSQEDENRFIASSSFLIIDDFSGMRTMLSGILRNCGANPKAISFAADGRDALHQLGAQRYDVVLCDYNLGTGQNGMQVLEEARHRQLIGPSCCWVMVTADKTVETVMGAAEALPDAYLIKPVTEAALVSRINKIKVRKEAFKDIDQAILGQEYSRAIQLCDERAAVDKANAIELLRLKCELLIRTGQAEKARGFYEKLLAAREIPWAQLGLARTFLQTGDPDTACELLEQLVNRSRSYLEAYDCLAETYRQLALDEKAEHIIERALTLSPRSHARQRQMGELALATGKLERAEKAFRQAIQLSEFSVHKSPDSYLGLARVVNGRGNAQEALNILDQMGKVFDDDQAVLQAKSVECRIFLDSGKEGQAKKSATDMQQLMERGEADRLDPQTARDIAETLLIIGETEKALELLRTEVMNNPEDHANLEAIRQILRKNGLTEEGNELVENSRREAIEMMNSSALLSRSGDFQTAVNKVRKALEMMPRNVRLLFNAAHIMLSHMEKNGPDSQLLRETRRHLATANLHAPGEPRHNELMIRLEALSTAE